VIPSPWKIRLVNLRLRDYLTPVAPLQIALVAGSNRQFANATTVSVRERLDLTNRRQEINDVMKEFSTTLDDDPESARLQTALELYGTHFSERDAKTRFLLLIMALEALTIPTERPEIARTLLDRFHAELRDVRQQLSPDSHDAAALDALERELFFRRQDSIRSQIRKLVQRAVPNDPGSLARRALELYDKRSTLVHEGKLPASGLRAAEEETRRIVASVLCGLLNSRSYPPEHA